MRKDKLLDSFKNYVNHDDAQYLINLILDAANVAINQTTLTSTDEEIEITGRHAKAINNLKVSE